MKQIENEIPIWCEVCEHFENHTTDDFISARCKKYNEDLEFYDWFIKCDKCFEEEVKEQK